MASDGPSLPETVTYYVFLEEISYLSPDRGLDGPDGLPLRARPDILSRQFYRVRFSGIRASCLNDLRSSVGELGNHDISDEQRLRRRFELNALFERTPVPVVDLFWPAEDGPPLFRRPKGFHHLSPGLWYLIKATRGNAATAPLPVLIGEPESGRPVDEFGSGQVEFIGRPVHRVRKLLRDIFSLKHLSDEGFDDGPDGPGYGPPPDGGDAPAGEAQMTDEIEIVEVEVPHWAAIERPAREDDDPQYVTVSN
jgi:hypothetical protein